MTSLVSVATAVAGPPLLARVLKLVRESEAEAAAADERCRDLDASHARLVESEAALRASEDRFRGAFEDAPVGWPWSTSMAAGSWATRR